MFLHPSAKLPKKVNVNAALYNSVVSTRGETAASTVVTACRALQELRAVLHEPPTTEGSRDGILRYHRALQEVLDEGGISPELSVPLLWVSAFDPEEDAEVPDLRMDVVSAMFNLAVNESALALAAFRRRRTDNGALRTATQRFTVAAGYFHAAGMLPTPGGVSTTTSDLWPVSLRALESVMLGNAQQAFFLFCEDNGKQPTLLARLALGAREFYAVAADMCRDPSVVDSHVNALVGKPADALSAYLSALANSLAARAAHKDANIAVEIVRLRRAHEMSARAAPIVNAIDITALVALRAFKEDLSDALRRLSDDLVERLESAEEENRRLYLESLPEFVPDIVPHQSVHPADAAALLRAAPLDARLSAFKDLPPALDPAASGVAARYADSAATLVAQHVARINAAADSLRHSTARIPRAVADAHTAASAISSARAQSEQQHSLAPASSGGLTMDEQRAVDAIEFAKTNGGAPALRELHSQVLAQADEFRRDVEGIECLLRNEEEQDRMLRNYMSTRRTNSYELTAGYRSKLGKLRSNMEQAANADAIMTRQMQMHSDGIAALAKVNTDAAVKARKSASTGTTAATREGGTLNVEQTLEAVERIAQELDTLRDTGERLLSRTSNAVQRLELARARENTTTATVGITEGDEEVEQFGLLLERTYGNAQRDGNALAEQLDAVTAKIASRLVQLSMSADIDVGDHRNGSNPSLSEDSATALMLEVFKHQPAAIKFAEILDHLQQGMHFYSKEQENVVALKRDVDGFVAARDAEYKSLMKHSNGATGTSSFGLYPRWGRNADGA